MCGDCGGCGVYLKSEIWTTVTSIDRHDYLNFQGSLLTYVDFVTSRYNFIYFPFCYDSLRLVTIRYNSLHYDPLRPVTICYDPLRLVTLRYNSLHFVTTRQKPLQNQLKKNLQ